jgi:anti-sigma B factor antagonist
MTTSRVVMVKELPPVLDAQGAQAFFHEIAPHIQSDRPSLVFDFSAVRYLDSAGVDLLLRCVEEAMKRNGDIKLAGVSPEMATVLEMTRVDRLFEIFDTCSNAVDSFHRFSARALQPSISEPLDFPAQLEQRDRSEAS